MSATPFRPSPGVWAYPSNGGSPSVLDRSDQQLLGPVLYLQWAQTDTRHLIEKVDIRESIRRVYEKMARQPVMIGNVVILREQPSSCLQNSGDL